MHVNDGATTGAGAAVAVHPLIGPQAGPMQEGGGSGVGVWWATDADGPGVIHRLGNGTYLTVTATTLTPFWNNR